MYPKNEKKFDINQLFLSQVTISGGWNHLNSQSVDQIEKEITEDAPETKVWLKDYLEME
jgi:hypothetical protein